MRHAAVKGLFCAMGLALATPAAAEGGLSPVGRWKTIDDESGKAKSIVVIWDDGGPLYGKIEKLFLEPNEDQNPVCDKCEGARKNQPIVGMNILWGLKRDGEEWSGGQVLDPANGKSYKCFVEVVEGGKKLKVRGFIGFALLGRTQHWVKAE